MHPLRSTIAKKFGCSVESAAGEAYSKQEQVLATTRTCAAAMDAAGRVVTLRRAGTPAERQRVVCLVKKHWDRVGQRPREHLLVWDTADGSAPADALLEDTEQAYEELPWFHKAAIGDGAPCSYHRVVRECATRYRFKTVSCSVATAWGDATDLFRPHGRLTTPATAREAQDYAP